MDSAKNAVKDFMHKSGKNDTTVHENFSPAVTNETVNQHRHENVTTAVDKEVHQDHYHTTVQPVHDTKQLPEQHHHNLAATEHRKFEHGNDDEVQRRLQAENAKFKDSTVKGDTHHTTSAAPTVSGEHVHHHVHENIQPVVNRQTVEPHVVHTTVPIHEVHHSSAQHHNTSALPAVSMADFKKQGGSLSGREQRSDFFEGEPRHMAGHNPLHPETASDKFRNTGHVDNHGHGGSSATSGLTGDRSTTGSGLTGSSHTGTHGSGMPGSSTTGSSGLTGDRHTGTSGHNSSGLGSTGTDTTHKKPSLLDRINPMKDTDGDGKKGIME